MFFFWFAVLSFVAALILGVEVLGLRKLNRAGDKYWKELHRDYLALHEELKKLREEYREECREHIELLRDHNSLLAERNFLGGRLREDEEILGEVKMLVDEFLFLSVFHLTYDSRGLGEGFPLVDNIVQRAVRGPNERARESAQKDFELVHEVCTASLAVVSLFSKGDELAERASARWQGYNDVVRAARRSD